MSDTERLERLFKQLDLDGDNALSAAEIVKGFQSMGKKPSLVEIYAMIDAVDKSGNRKITFEMFSSLHQQVSSGEIPSTTGLASLISLAFEDYIKTANKAPPKNQYHHKTPTAFVSEAPEGEKWKLGNKKKGYKPGSLPPKKGLAELP